MLTKGKVVEFDRKKEFKYIRPLGKGGTGDTHLFEDETTSIYFAIKKYDPTDLDRIDEYYNRFVDEIKILFRIAHPNIVRIYNYYLYPEFKLGYLQMEYVEGTVIDEYIPDNWNKQWDEVFIDVISAFEYLEKNKILHRDIRPANFLINQNGNIKIIDFGFGKRLEPGNTDKNSIVLNWPVTEMPEEINQNSDYSHQTELYFVGMLFKKLLGDQFKNFKFYNAIEEMIQIDPENRTKSFEEVSNLISTYILNEIDFTADEKSIYQNFANALISHITKFQAGLKFKNDIEEINKGIAKVIIENALEETIQENKKLINCFVQGGYTYKPNSDIKLNSVKEFYEFLNHQNFRKQKVILDNIQNKLLKIPQEQDDDLPF